MTAILSTNVVNLDISSQGFRHAAGDLGEVIALLAGGVRPDPDVLSRLHLSMRAIQAFLIEEGQQQAAREAIAEDDVLADIAKLISCTANRTLLSVREVIHAPA